MAYLCALRLNIAAQSPAADTAISAIHAPSGAASPVWGGRAAGFT